MRVQQLIFLAFTIALISCNTQENKTIDLSGQWAFQIDSLDKGVTEKWYNKSLDESVTLPGSMVENGKGDDISIYTHWVGGVQNRSWYTEDKYEKYRQPGNVKIPFWLQPDKKYYGAAWYQKQIEIPLDWAEQQITLHLERCHWETKVWIDDQFAGMKNRLGTAHDYDITPFLTPGKHLISICVDNRIKEVNPGVNAHSVSDHTQSNWHGIVGDIALKAQTKISIEDVRVFPDVNTKTAEIKIKINNQSNDSTDCFLTLSASCEKGHNPGNQRTSHQLTSGMNEISLTYTLGDDILLWDEFQPNIYSLSATLKWKAGFDHMKVDFGVREFAVQGTQFTINGRPLFLRGTLECAIFPKTGYPAMDVAEWTRICQVVKSHGLNHIRFHSWCPPEAAFIAADKSGIYLQVECSSWANQGSTIGDGLPIDQWLYDESEAIVKAYGNHPSFCLMAYGNEPAGKNQKKFLSDFIEHWKSKDLRRVYTGGAGWPAIKADDFHNSPAPRIQGWGEQLRSIINAEAPKSDYDWSQRINQWDIPVVSHEIGQWCVYPDFKEIEKYTGVLKAKNFEIFREDLKDKHMEHLADSFLWASGKLQALCYKADIEAALRTKDFAGFQLLDLHDFPGQGTALVGVLNSFWEEKGYITPTEFSEFCNTTVPLARLPKHIYTNDETLTSTIEVAHFGEEPLKRVVATWNISDFSGRVVQEGKLKRTNIQVGNKQELGVLTVPLSSFTKAEQLKLTVFINEFKNSWDFWVYPSQPENRLKQKTVKVASSLDKATIDYLNGGGNVILTLKKGSLKPEYGGDIGIGFSSIFWNTAWTGGQKPHTLGILCNPRHPAFAEFPTQYYSNWQWWDAMSHSQAINLDLFPVSLKPIVRVIDDWVSNRRLALLFEARLGKGKIIVSGIDLVSNRESRPEARQLLLSLESYIESKQCSPDNELEIDEINGMIH